APVIFRDPHTLPVRPFAAQGLRVPLPAVQWILRVHLSGALFCVFRAAAAYLPGTLPCPDPPSVLLPFPEPVLLSLLLPVFSRYSSHSPRDRRLLRHVAFRPLYHQFC